MVLLFKIGAEPALAKAGLLLHHLEELNACLGCCPRAAVRSAGSVAETAGIAIGILVPLIPLVEGLPADTKFVSNCLHASCFLEIHHPRKTRMEGSSDLLIPENQRALGRLGSPKPGLQ